MTLLDEAKPSEKKIPALLVAGVIVICVLPFLSNLAGVDFATPQYRISPLVLSTMGPHDVEDAAYHLLRGAFIHTLLEWSAFCTAIFTVILAFAHFRITRNIVTPIIGVALFCAGCMDAFHTIAADHLVNPVADIRNLIPFTWAICRVFNALIMIAGIGLFLVLKPKRWQENFGFVLLISLAFGLIAYGTIHVCATSAHLPQTMYPDSIITRPWDVVPLILYLFAGLYLFPVFFRRTPSLFSHALIISIIPQVATQIHMAFGSTELFDNHFNIAHFLKILAYFVPHIGLTLDYVQTYRHERIAVARLESANEQLGSEIEERRQVEEALAQARQHEAEIAHRIQKTLLLGKPPRIIPGLQLAALTVPSQTVDGDFYDFRQFRGDRESLDIIIGDVMGKGIPAALLGAATKGHLERTISALWHGGADNELPAPEEIVNALHGVLVKELIDLESFVTLCYARFTISERRMDFVDCGHPKTIHYRHARKKCMLLSGENMPLGVSEDEVYTRNSVTFEEDDLFLFYSDGITEARNKAGEFFGEERLKKFICANNRLQPARLLESLRHSVAEFAGSETFADDLTCVAVKITGASREEPFLHAEQETSSDLKELASARAFLRRFCRDLPAPGIGEDDLDLLEIAVNEALVNIIQHAYGGRSGQKIQIMADAYADRICIRLYHWGEPFEDDAASPPVPDRTQDSGFGLYLIAQSVEEVRYSRDEQGRNCVFLLKRLPKGA